MFKPLVSLFMLGTLALPVCAHELWLERDGEGPVRVYLGEPDQDVIERGETIAALAPTTKLLAPTQSNELVVRDDHLEAEVDGQDDIRAVNDQVWKPWENDDGKITAALMHARWGRTELEARMDLELVPVAVNGNRFTLLYKGKPLADTTVMLITPNNQAQEMKTDEQGLVALTMPTPGRYIVAASHETDADGQTVAGQTVDRLYNGTTTSFVVE